MQFCKKINLYIFNQRKKIILKNREKKFLNYGEIKNCLLLCSISNDSDFANVLKLKNLLISDNKDVTTVCYVKHKKSTLKSDNQVIIIKREDLSFGGNIPENVVNQIHNHKFDVVFDVTQKSSIPLLYTLIFANSAFFCGTSENRNFNFDFILETSELQSINDIYILEQFVFYLKSINSK